MWLVCSWLAFAATSMAQASQANPPAAPMNGGAGALSSGELDRAIQEVIRQPKYTWRMPREKLAQAENKGVIGRFLERAGKLCRKWLKSALDWLDDWLRKLLHRRARTGAEGSGYGWILALELLLYLLVAGVLVALALLVYQVWRDRQRRRQVVASAAVQPVPDLSDETVGAEQLPEEGWMRLGRELWERGELRLALRAFYLASLAQLAENNLVSLARFKSNHDYVRELGRRGHAVPEVLASFSETVQVFDRTWYGLHEVNAEQVGEFAANVERMKSCT